MVFFDERQIKFHKRGLGSGFSK